MRKLGFGVVLAAVIVAIAGAFAPPVEAEGDKRPGPLLRAVQFLAEQVREGFASVGEQLDGLQQAQTLSLQNQTEILAVQSRTSDQLTAITNILSEGQRADLTVTFGLGPSPFQCVVRDDQLILEVANLPSAEISAPASILRFWALDSPFPFGTFIFAEDIPVPPLAPGEFFEVGIKAEPICDLMPPNERCSYLLAVVDPDGVVPESDDSNNGINLFGSSCGVIFQ